MQNDVFLDEYSSREAVQRYTRATAGFGISYLLDHDYRDVYCKALSLLSAKTRMQGIRMLEFGCGGGMNVLHLISVLGSEGWKVELAIGTDFSPTLIEAAKQEVKNYLGVEQPRIVQFCVARNEALVQDLQKSLGTPESQLKGSFHFILGVNTIRYCHRLKTEVDCARGILDLLMPGGVCTVIDMNNRFPLFRTALRDRLCKQKDEHYLPSLEEYAAPFRQVGFDVLRQEHFCWIPHSSGRMLCGFMRGMSPLLNTVVPSRAMRSLIVARKPIP